MADHPQIQEAIAAYVTHALDPLERSETERMLLEHLPGCEECTALMRDLRELAGDLALMPDARSMSETSERALLSRIQGTQPIPAARARTAWPRAAAAVVALVIAASAALNVIIASRANRSDARARAAIAAVAVLTDPSARHTVLQGASGSLAVSVLPSGKGVLIASGLAAPPKGSVYELWLAKDGGYVPVRVFSPAAGDAVLSFRVAPAPYSGSAVTVERGFVRQPTTTPIFSGSIPA
jgi:anti-sigma factor RsiW